MVFVVDKAAPGQVFSEYFGFPCQAFHRLLYTHIDLLKHFFLTEIASTLYLHALFEFRRKYVRYIFRECFLACVKVLSVLYDLTLRQLETHVTICRNIVLIF
jgi:hypothetical protein